MKVFTLRFPLGVRSRIFNVLNNAGIETCEQLVQTPARELKKWPNFGQRSVDALSYAMFNAGYQWPPVQPVCPHCHRPMP